jgi:hypothetical protein
MEEERTIGDYTVQLWRNTAGEGFGFDNLVTISSGGQILARVEFASALGEYTGRDVTGEGHPDVVIEGFTGGAHCCFSTMTYDLGPALTKVLETPPSNCAGRLEDLTGDGVYEFVTCDDVFAYTYCAYAFSPLVKVILQYEPGQGYVPASPRFAALYEEDIAAHSRLAQDAASYVDSGWDGTPKCAVLPLVLDYLYSGRGEQAWDALNRFYDYPDRLLFWTEVVQTIADSSLYAASGSLPAVEVPPYYMLQLLTHCGPDSRYVGLLGQGQAGCDPRLPHRDIFWLEMQLRDIGLLNEGETLQLTPEACTTNCRLDLVRTSDSVRLGSIRLDTASGFPGAVYRVNGVESARWRLRGDLTWEKASQ